MSEYIVRRLIIPTRDNLTRALSQAEAAFDGGDFESALDIIHEVYGLLPESIGESVYLSRRENAAHAIRTLKKRLGVSES